MGTNEYDKLMMRLRKKNAWIRELKRNQLLNKLAEAERRLENSDEYYDRLDAEEDILDAQEELEMLEF